MAVAPIRASESAKPSNQQQAIEIRPVGEGIRLQFSGTSFAATRAALLGTFGAKFPLRLNSKIHKMMVVAMAEVAKANGQGQAPYNQIIDALAKYGDIEISEM